MIKTATTSLLLGIAACIAGVHFWLAPAVTREALPLSWEAGHMRVEAGTRTPADGGLGLRLNHKGQGFIKLPIHAVDGHDYPYLQLLFANPPPATSSLVLWETGQPGDTTRVYRVPGSLEHSVYLNTRDIPGWAGDITTLVLAIVGRPGQEITVERVELLPPSPLRQLTALYSDWVSFSPWQHSSINSYLGVRSAASSVYPVPVMAAVVALSLVAYTVLLLLFRAAGRFDWRVVAVIFMAGWISLDLAWQWRLMRQLEETCQTFCGKGTEQKIAGGIDAELVGLISEFRQQVKSPEAKIFVSSSDDYRGMRGAYYLYPFNVYWKRRGPELPEAKHLHSGDYIVVLSPSTSHFDPTNNTLSIPGDTDLSVVPILSRPTGSLFRVM